MLGVPGFTPLSLGSLIAKGNPCGQTSGEIMMKMKNSGRKPGIKNRKEGLKNVINNRIVNKEARRESLRFNLPVLSSLTFLTSRSGTTTGALTEAVQVEALVNP